MALDTIPKQEGGKLKAVASGTLPSGEPVVVNADGTVSVITTESGSQTLGTPATFLSVPMNVASSVYDPDTQKIIVAYRQNNGSNYGYAVVGTVSGMTISFGSPVVFESASTYNISMVYDANAQKVVIAYRDYGNSQYGTAIVGTVSGNSISFGSPAVFESAVSDYISAVYDANAQKVVIAYRDVNNSNYGTAVVGTVSGTSISFGSPTLFNNGYSVYISATYDANAQKVVIAYNDTSNSNYGTAVVGTVSGTSISFGTEVVFLAGTTSYVSSVYDSKAQKTVILYQDGNNSDKATGIVGTVSGTSISFGSSTAFSSSSFDFLSSTYDSVAGKIVAAYRDYGNSYYGTLNVGTVSGTSISFGSSVVFESANSFYFTLATDTDAKKVVIAYGDGGNSSLGTSVVFQNEYNATNLTSENYIGMSGGVVKVIDSQEESLGSQTAVYTGAIGPSSIVYDTGQNKLLIVYKGISDYGTAVVGTVSGSSISFGTPVVFISSTTNYPSATFDPNAGKTGIFWADYGASQYGKACVATISGTSVSFGSTVTFSATTTGGQKDSTFYASQNKILLAYRESASSSKIRAATISGTSISFGSAVNIGPSQVTNLMAVGYDTNAGKALLAYQNRDNNRYIDSKVVTLSGTTVSLGSQVSVYADGAADTVSMAYDSTNNKMVVAYRHDTGDLLLRLIAGSISGTSVSYGTAVSTGVKFNGNPSVNHIHFNAAAGKVVYAGRDDANSYHQKYVTATVSGTDISVETPVTYYAATSYTSSSAYDPDQEKSVLFYASSSFSNPAVKILTVGYENITRGSVADGDNAVVDIVGTVSTNQLSLTAGQQYYVQTDGTLSETPADPSVLAGTAISATKLIVKT